ncbi:unnamed protein product [Adineta steineri]|uniref:Cadherin-like protein n=1 Tax=Adineta steineri TaxID=433720 RepID=A0A813XLV7_9BILA|nr:unnamed protein product [Adineta steineri]CAF3600373.1 unnamed protein product [Adineta steineri]
MMKLYLLFIFYIKINFTSGQLCQNDIPDFFYNISFAGPLFNQTVYTSHSDLSVAIPNDTTVFQFTVRSRTIYDRPSYISTNFTSRILRQTETNIDVTSSDPSFIVKKDDSLNDTYSLVTNISPLNYSLPYNRYLFELIAEQYFSDRPPAISTALVQIDLKNDNVHRPRFISDKQEFYISETAEIGTQFGTVYATDDDRDEIFYSTTSTQFSIGLSTGVLRLEHPFSPGLLVDHFNETITIKDSPCLLSDPLCHSESIIITIFIITVNKNSPRFLQNICGTSIQFLENNTRDQTIALLYVYDDDRGENGQINILFPSEQSRTTVSGLRNTAYSQFYIEQLNQTGSTRQALIKTNEIFDYDEPGTTRVWYLFILAVDNGKPQRQAFCSLRIDLIDINDNRPKFAMTSWSYTIYRSSFTTINNTTLLRIIADDADSGLNGLINYYIGSLYIPYFTINRRTGYIAFRSDISGIETLDASRFPITFDVYAQDCGTPQLLSENNATVTIYYNDNDDLPPARWLNPLNENFNISITEKFYEKYLNQPVFDNNSSFNGSIMYTLTSDTSSIMTVYSPFLNQTNMPFRAIPVIKDGSIFRSGIAVINGFHAEIQDKYVLYIRVLVDPPLVDSITIRLIDENDQIPTFDIRSITLSVVQNEQGRRIIAQIQAYDRDVDARNNHVEYRLNQQLSDKEANETFHVESNGTIWTNTVFDETNINKTSYRLFITAYNTVPSWDNNVNHTEDLQIDVQVIRINEHLPEFNTTNSMVNITINETTSSGTTIGNFSIIDKDIDTKLTLGILSGNSRNAFNFILLSNNSDNPNRTQYEATGSLEVIAPLDYISQSIYTLTLFAFDTKNTVTLIVNITLIPQNTKAPCFKLMPGFTSFEYQVNEETAYTVLDGSIIKAIDPDNLTATLYYKIYDTNHQLNLNNLVLNKTDDYVTIGIKAPGLSHDYPFGSSIYNFAIEAIDENGTGISSYVPVRINVIKANNKAPILKNFPWIIDEGINPMIPIEFIDYDEPGNRTLYEVKTINSPNFEFLPPTLSSNKTFTLVYNGTLNCTTTKYLHVTINASIINGSFAVTTIPIMVRGKPNNTYPIYNGDKIIKILYVNGYQNSLRNTKLGSIYVSDSNDCVRDNRIYSIRNNNNEQNFNVSEGFLTTSNVLYPGISTIYVDVTKLNLPSALSTIKLDVENIDSEYIREASTIRIQGEYPTTLIDPTLGYRLDKLRQALSSILSVDLSSIIILSLRAVYQYRNPFYPPKPLDIEKAESLTDVTFYVSDSYKYQVEDKLNTNLGKLQSDFQFNATASGPNPCNNYFCPKNTICRPTRIIGLNPSVIDTDQASFVGINILDSADCVNSNYTTSLTNTPPNCAISTYNNLSYCPLGSVSLSNGPVGSCCEILGRTFDGNDEGYAIYGSSTFSNFPPTRFSFDFLLQTTISNGLILLYGQNVSNINDFFWIAIEIVNFKLKFHFRDTKLYANNTELNASVWYHVEYQILGSNVLVSVNDCQYNETVNTTLNTYNSSIVELYLGGLPPNSSVLNLYQLQSSVNPFKGCIRNVLSNGYYLDMSKHHSSNNSNYGQCPCSITKSCTTEKNTIIIPWYTWLIIALVLLLLTTIIIMTLLALIRKKQQLTTLSGLYIDDTRDTIVDYKETAGEEDYSAYNLRILKKPIYALTDGSIILNNDQLNNSDLITYGRPSLGDYIEEKLNQRVLSHANDTQLRYQYEGVGSIPSDLSSIDSLSLQNDIDQNYLYSLGPKFARLADIYSGNSNIDDEL